MSEKRVTRIDKSGGVRQQNSTKYAFDMHIILIECCKALFFPWSATMQMQVLRRGDDLNLYQAKEGAKNSLFGPESPRLRMRAQVIVRLSQGLTLQRLANAA
jgi:hypothetical protein